MDRHTSLLALLVLGLVGVGLVAHPVTAEPSDCRDLSEFENQSEYRSCLVENTSKAEILKIVDQDKENLSQKQIDAVHAVYPYYSDEYGFNQSEERRITAWMSGVDLPESDNNDSADGDGSGSTWSKARVLALIDDPVSRHSDVDVGEIEVWYQANKGQFSETEQRYVESWIDWAKTGERVDGLHPDLATDDSEDTTRNRLNGTISPRSLDQGRKEVTGDVTIIAHEMRPANQTAVMIVEAERDTTITVTDSLGSYGCVESL